VVLLIAALAAIPLFFKGTLMEKTKTTINKNVNAEVEFADLKISLLRNFPKLSLELTDVTVTGSGEFQSDTLMVIPSMQATTPLGNLIGGGQIGIEEIILTSPQLNLMVNDSGNANWDIAKETGKTAEPQTEASGMELQLEKIEIRDADFTYNDKELQMLLSLNDIDFDVSGKMYGTATELLVEGTVASFLLNYGGADYIKNTSLETRTLLNVDYEVMDIEIKENELLVNRLPLEVLGLIQMPNDSMFFDLQLKTKESGFDNFLALIPPGYESYLEGIETSGTATISGEANGFFIGENYPAFKLDMLVENGNLQYADLPEEIKQISANVAVSKSQGELNLTEVTIENAHAEVKNNPLDFSLVMNNLIADPFFDGSLKGKINFGDLKNALPIDSVNISGLMDADVKVSGNYSAIENENYTNIHSAGTVFLSDFVYASTDLTQQILIPGGKLEFSPRDVTLSEFLLNVGQSDFNLRGSVSNYLGYYFTDGTLTGNLSLNSSLVNLNELLRLQVVNEMPQEQPEETNSGEEVTEIRDTLAFSIPENIDFTFRSEIQRVVYDRLPITNVNGLITARNGELVLDGLNMDLLNGTLQLTGSYKNTPENQPYFDFGLNADGFDIPEAYKTLTGFRKMVPVAGQSEGEINTDLKVSGRLSPAFKLIAPTIDGQGAFSTENLRIVNSPVFNQLKGILKAEKLNNVAVQDFRASINIVDGGIQIDPFTTQIAGQETTVSGSINTQNLVDMRLDFQVEREAFGPDIQSILNVLPGEERIQLIPASVLVQGPVGEAQVKINLDEARKKITEEVKKSTKDDLQKSLDKLGKGLRDLFK
jgi:hypothetical protein